MVKGAEKWYYFNMIWKTAISKLPIILIMTNFFKAEYNWALNQVSESKIIKN